MAISASTGFDVKVRPMGDLSVLEEPGPYDIVKDEIVSYGDYGSRMDLWRFLAKNNLALYFIFGFDPAQETEELKKYTLIDNIQSGYPPTLIVQARYDHLVDLKQVESFHKLPEGKRGGNQTLPCRQWTYHGSVQSPS